MIKDDLVVFEYFTASKKETIPRVRGEESTCSESRPPVCPQHDLRLDAYDAKQILKFFHATFCEHYRLD